MARRKRDVKPKIASLKTDDKRQGPGFSAGALAYIQAGTLLQRPGGRFKRAGAAFPPERHSV